MPEKKSLTTHISTGKDLFALIRDLVLFVLALLLLFFPPTFNRILERAGFEEGNFMGMKWRKQVVITNDELETAKRHVQALQARLDSANKLLALSQTEVSNPALKNKISSAEVKNNALLKESAAVERSMSQTIAQNKPLVVQAEKMAGTTTQWGIVYGGDATLKTAQYETGVVANKYNLPNTVIYLKGGSYRSLSVVYDRAEAEAVLNRAKKRRPDAYMVRMEKWCANATEQDGYFECN